MAETVQAHAGLPALRDFFAAKSGMELRAGALGVARSFGFELDPETDWTEVEYDFNRLFVGPAKVPAPPYASAYDASAQEPSLMGRSSLAVREAYRRMGLAVPDQGKTPDDHLAYELDAVIALENMDSLEVEHAKLAEVRTWMLEEHMAVWVPKFTAAVRAQPDVSAPVRMALSALEDWLAKARALCGAGGGK